MTPAELLKRREGPGPAVGTDASCHISRLSFLPFLLSLSIPLTLSFKWLLRLLSSFRLVVTMHIRPNLIVHISVNGPLFRWSNSDYLWVLSPWPRTECRLYICKRNSDNELQSARTCQKSDVCFLIVIISAKLKKAQNIYC